MTNTQEVSKKSTSFGGIRLSKYKGSDSPLIPTTPSEVILPKAQKTALATAVEKNLTCVLIGETGTGKTSALRHLAYLRNQPYIRINMNGYTTPDELIGSKSASSGSTYFEKGILIQALELGALLVVDELNSATPECLFLFHSLLDEDRRITLPNGEVVTPHSEFRFFATMNPEYEGTKSLNRAFIDRFAISLVIESMKPDKEEDYIVSRTGISQEDAHNMVLFATAFRKVYVQQKTSTFASTRSLLQWADLVKAGFTLEQAFDFAFINKLRSEEKIGALDVFQATTKKNIDMQKEGDSLVIVKKSEVDSANSFVQEMRKEMTEKLFIKDKEIEALKATSSANLQGEIDYLRKTLNERSQELVQYSQELDKSRLEVRTITSEKLSLQREIVNLTIELKKGGK